MALTNKLKAIADAIRQKTGTTAKLSLDQMGAAIAAIQSGGISGIDVLFDQTKKITYTSTAGATAATYTVPDIHKYPFVLVSIENTDTSVSNLKFIRSMAVVSNATPESTAPIHTRAAVSQYYDSDDNLANLASTTYGLFGYQISNNSLVIRGRCSTSYFPVLTGTYRIKVFGCQL